MSRKYTLTKGGGGEGEHPDDLRAMTNLERYRVTTNMVVKLATLAAGVVVALYLHSIWPMAASPLVEGINFLNQLKLNKSP